MNENPLTLHTLFALIRADLQRYAGRSDAREFLRRRAEPGFRFSYWWRIARQLGQDRRTRYTLYPLARARYFHYTYKFGISIPLGTSIGPGLYIGHFGGIVIHSQALIGKNCNLSHGVTIGVTNRGRRAGVPQLGDEVYIGPGAKIIGGVTVGSYAAIGANCVVTSDVPERGVVVGIPGRVISLDGSAGYIQHPVE